MKSVLQKRLLSGLGLAILMLGLICRPGTPAYAAEEEEPPQWSFVPTRYQLIGRHPDSLITYTGSARIDRVGGQLRLTKVIAGKHSQIYGVIRRADPGEAYVLDFKRRNKNPLEMVCVIGSDLDNYPRLTCHWGKAGNPHRQPGMEAYFAQEPWDPLSLMPTVKPNAHTNLNR